MTNPKTYTHVERKDLKYDKMRKMKWVNNHIRGAFNTQWKLGKFLIVDEMMVK